MKLIDCEHHYYLKDFLQHLRNRTEYPLIDKDGVLFYREKIMLPTNLKWFNSELKLEDELVDLDDFRLSIMNKAGVACGVISSVGCIEDLPKDEAVKYARLTNDAIAAACEHHPGRFMGTACLPTCYVDEAVKELERCVNKLGFKYWHTHSNYGNEYLFQEKFEPILAKCADLGLVFYLHPFTPSTPYLLQNGAALSSAGFGYGVDTMRTAILLILGGIFDRYPNLRMVLGHMGDYFPYCLDRMDNRFFSVKWKDPNIKCKKTFTEYFQNKNIFMTTSGIYEPNVIICAMNTIGIDSIVYGADFPFEDLKGSADFIRNLPIRDEDKEKIAHLNAEKYLL